MIITSKIDNTKYQWIRVPRTATMAYGSLFLSNKINDNPFIHSHLTYNNFFTCDDCINYEKMNLDAFALVRNPVDRFISSIYFMASRRENLEKDDQISKNFNKYCEICGKVELVDTDREKYKNIFLRFYENESFFYDFFYNNFNKNCQLKPGLNIYSVFDTDDVSLVSSFFYTQVYWAYHPKIKVFKYENISEFNKWIENKLGYDTTQLKKTNASRKSELQDIINVDFTTDKFKKLVKYLFHDDFLYFNYEFPL
jgi:hypothetical protein